MEVHYSENGDPNRNLSCNLAELPGSARCPLVASWQQADPKDPHLAPASLPPSSKFSIAGLRAFIHAQAHSLNQGGCTLEEITREDAELPMPFAPRRGFPSPSTTTSARRNMIFARCHAKVTTRVLQVLQVLLVLLVLLVLNTSITRTASTTRTTSTSIAKDINVLLVPLVLLVLLGLLVLPVLLVRLLLPALLERQVRQVSLILPALLVLIPPQH